MITDIANVILCYEIHLECTQLAVTRLGKQSLILEYNWLCNHNPESNWQTKDVKMSHCPLQCSTCRGEDKCDAKTQKSMTSQINACRSGAFPTMVEEDKDESPHMNMDETDEEAQDTGPAFDDNLGSVRGHPSVSLPPLSYSPILHSPLLSICSLLFICTLPHSRYHH
jgi:hypothetical protein